MGFVLAKSFLPNVLKFLISITCEVSVKLAVGLKIYPDIEEINAKVPDGYPINWLLEIFVILSKFPETIPSYSNIIINCR